MEFGKKLTNDARDALSAAEIFARSSGSEYIGTEHLLLGIANQNRSEAAHILFDSGITFDKLREAMKISENQVKQTIFFSPTKGFSEMAKLGLRMSVELANEFKSDFCSTEHILFSILNQRNSRGVKIIEDLGGNISRVIGDLEDFLREESGNLNLNANANEDEFLANSGRDRQTEGSFLSKFSKNLTKMAENDQIDPVIGREKEIERVMTILSRRRKNNPVLIGEAGVGKTAIAEGLAIKIAKNEVPEQLRGKYLLQVDLAGLLAGTKFRGEFEERIKRLVDESAKNPNIILFIDELHLLSGAGAGEGSMDAANMLKPALARGEIRLIGATTNDEYRKGIEKDAALTRRFQAIEVEQPNFADTIRIIQGAKGNYEKFHKVKLSDKVIEHAVRLSDRYLSERFQPDKSFDVIDEASAMAKISNEKTQKNRGKEYDPALMMQEKSKLREKMEAADTLEDYEKSALYKMRISRIDDRLAEIEAERQNEKDVILRKNDIESAISQMTGIPVEKLSRSESKRILSLEKKLSRRIIGQSAAIREVSRSVKRNAAGIYNGKRPIGSFVFLGPTGVGKTETAKVLADEVFGGEKNLIKIDMSEFSESHSGARLTGAPAGYVGYEDGGNLTERVRRNPYSVVLFDEIEKASPKVFNLFLQILEDGCLTDGHGKKIDFSNTIVILTSNIGAADMAKESLGFVNDDISRAGDQQLNNESAKKYADINSGLKEIMRPELLNRFDAIIDFYPLSRKEINQIFDLQIEDLNERLALKGVRVVMSKSAKNHLIELGFDEKMGARPLRRIIQDQVEGVLAENLLKGKIRRGDAVEIGLKNDKIISEKIKETTSFDEKIAKIESL